ncbi:unnamed protein product [Spodoptera littoralis]|uniref:Uncharacterized protein n=1 Tax=Spodoptera littoralis TaxID=7109 RepID=A0A9P0HY90_SPOLI|nr:unnamed protein product [Spodoptera littoralis]CAH1637672.1 unnamed protein product [Spodoptera littoralis]
MMRHDVVGAVLHIRVETAVVIAMVVNMSDGAIRLMQGVVSLHHVTVAVLMLRLEVSSVGVLYFIPELVFWVSVVIMVVVSISVASVASIAASVSMVDGLVVTIVTVDVLGGVGIA